MACSLEDGGRLSVDDIAALHVSSTHLDCAHEAGWQTSPELPTADEIMAREAPGLPRNDIEMPPESKNDYLRTQYSLFRCEGTELLRLAVSGFRNDPQAMEGPGSYIYTQVHTCGYFFSHLGPACRLSFSTERSPLKVNWGQSERLMPGTLVAISPVSDGFKTQCILATIAARHRIGGLEPDIQAGEDQFTPPRIDVFWTKADEAIIDPAIEFVMIEAAGGYFETVRHAMVGLQHAARVPSRFDKYLVDACPEVQSAMYLDEVSDHTAVVPEAAQRFDQSQREAFEHMTSDELCIVQGPPGTGKTFTSVVAIGSYVRTLKDCDRPGPIIITAQTNHALDQLLQLCIKHDVGQVVRLGSRSCEESIEERNMYNLRQRSEFRKSDRIAEVARKKALTQLQEAIKTSFPDSLVPAGDLHKAGIITANQLASLDEGEWETASCGGGEQGMDGLMANWLDQSIEKDRLYVYTPPKDQADPDTDDEKHHGLHYEPDDEDRDHPHGEFVPIKLRWTGTIPPEQAKASGTWWKQAEKLAKNADLYRIKPPQRGMVYRYWRRRLIDKVSSSIPFLLERYQGACDRLKASRWANNVTILKQEGIQIIGCTTTGLTKYRDFLAATRPRILLVEEAAETREASITSGLFPSLEQVVLVGDHQQLPPHVDVRKLESAPFNLTVSLFQRLVGLGVPYSALKVQRRMIPSIREMVHTFYPRLEDHADVKDPLIRPPVAGMAGQNLWWFQHGWPEKRRGSSCMNLKEADMIVGLVKYLVRHGMEPGQITILTYYNGQVKLIQQKIRLSGLDEECAVRTVDGFQGEENDVILLSLVRGPPQNGPARAGFVKDENRAVVATSRARCGFYIFGNARNLLESNRTSKQTWQGVFGVFDRQKRTGTRLPVACAGGGKANEVRQPSDWDTVLSGSQCQTCNALAVSNPADPPQGQRGRPGNDGPRGRSRGGHLRGGAPRGRGSKRGPGRVGGATWVQLNRKDVAPSISSIQPGVASSVPPSQNDDALGQHVTSDDLIANGYFSLDQRQGTLEADGGSRLGETWASGTDGLLIDTAADDEAAVPPWALRPPSSTSSSRGSTALSSTCLPQAIGSKWTVETCEWQESMLQRGPEGGQTRGEASSVTIRETFRPTTTDAAGHRIYDTAAATQKTIVAPTAAEATMGGAGDAFMDLEAITGSMQHGRLSRKGQLLDDVSGFGSDTVGEEETVAVDAAAGPRMGVLLEL